MALWQTITKALTRTALPLDAVFVEKPADEVLDVKAVPVTPVPFWPRDVWLRTATAAPLDRYTAFTASVVAYLCIMYRATKLSEPPLMVVDESEEGEEWLENHEMAGLLAHPNVDMPMRRMLALTSVYRDITGAAIWLKTRDRGGRTVRLYPYSFDEYQIEAGKDRLIGMFRVTVAGGKQIEVDPEDVVHFGGINPWDPVGAISPLDVALRMLQIDEELRNAAQYALENAVLPSGVLTVPEPLGDREFTQALQQLHRQHSGRNAGKPLLLTGGAKWETVALTIQQMMPSELTSLVESRVCAIFGIPPSVIGLQVGLENSPWSHMETAQKFVYDEMAIPRWRADEEVLTDQLLRDVDFDESHIVRFDTRDIDALQDDLTEKVEIAARGQGFLTVNEQRGYLGLPPIDGPVGDTIFIPATMVPADQVVSGGMGALGLDAAALQGLLNGNGTNGEGEEEEENDDEMSSQNGAGPRNRLKEVVDER